VPLTGKIITHPAEQYGMKFFPVLFSLLLMVLLSTIPVLGDNGPVNLSFSSLQEKGGYISGDLIITPLIKDGDNDGYITLWLNSQAGVCEAARLLSWKHITLGNDTRTIPVLAAVPNGITSGACQVKAIYGPGKLIPVSCDKGPSVTTSLTITAPGDGSHDMAGTLVSDHTGSGPDYRIDAIDGIDTTNRVAPGSTLLAEVTISNAGASDTSGEPVEVHAYLGSDELVPENAVIEPMKAGESQKVSLSYLVPVSTAQQGYPFFLIIDPQGEHGDADAKTNLKRTSGKMSVHIEDPGVGCGCK
jgi:hypothetical protein